VYALFLCLNFCSVVDPDWILSRFNVALGIRIHGQENEDNKGKKLTLLGNIVQFVYINFKHKHNLYTKNSRKKLSLTFLLDPD
jgi:hypothetical protein